MAVKFKFNEMKKSGKLYEPSGVTAISGGQYMAVQDEIEKNIPFYILADKEGVLKPITVEAHPHGWVDDLEGIHYRKFDKYAYAITSYSNNDKERCRLVRFKVPKKAKDDVRLKDAKGDGGLKKRIKRLFSDKEWKKRDGGFNIEGFALGLDKAEFLIGLRSPLIDNKAIIVETKGIGDAFKSNISKSVNVRKVKKLDLKGGGIRAISWIPDLKGYLLVSGRGDGTDKRKFPCKKGGKDRFFLLWFWDGDSKLREVGCFKKFKNFNKKKRKIQPEGICPAKIDGKKTILLVSDDGGDVKENGRYCLLARKEYKKIKKAVN